MGIVKIGTGRGVRLVGPDGLLQFEVEPAVAYNYHADLKRALVYPKRYPNIENEMRRNWGYLGQDGAQTRWHSVLTGPKGQEFILTIDGWKFRYGAE